MIIPNTLGPSVEEAIELLRSGEITRFVARNYAYGTIVRGIERLPDHRVKFKLIMRSGRIRTKIENIETAEENLRMVVRVVTRTSRNAPHETGAYRR